jgi:hypothetical protein
VTAARARPRTGDRGDYLAELAPLLWPPPARTEAIRHRSAAAGTTLLVLPGWNRPRLLVPSERRAASAALCRYGQPGSARARLGTRLLAAAIGAGLGSLLRDRLVVHAPYGAPTIEAYLAAALDQPVLVSTHLGTARANRKPVLQLLTSRGETVGFAKIGVNALTRRLVQAEHAALTRLAASPLGIVRTPRVLSLGDWGQHQVLVLSPLPVWLRRRSLRPGQLSAAMTAVATSAGVRRIALADSEYLRRLHRQLSAAAPGTDQEALSGLLPQLAERAGDRVLSFGCSHGDWTQWNMASTSGGLLVWDWERFTDDAPIGFDALHYWLQSRVVNPQRDPARTAAECVRRAPALLAPLGVAAGEAGLVALAYLADLSVRYLADRQHEAGARLGSPGRWLIPALTAGAATL